MKETEEAAKGARAGKTMANHMVRVDPYGRPDLSALDAVDVLDGPLAVVCHVALPVPFLEPSPLQPEQPTRRLRLFYGADLHLLICPRGPGYTGVAYLSPNGFRQDVTRVCVLLFAVAQRDDRG